MASINESFKSILDSRKLNIKEFLDLLRTDYHIYMSRWYLYYLLKHPEKITVQYVRLFTRVLDLNHQQQRDLFL